MRKLGKVIPFSVNSTLNDVISQKNMLLRELAVNGVICIRHLNFNPKTFYQMTTQIFGQAINLPAQYSFFKDPQYPACEWVGNIKPTKQVVDEFRDAVGWHTDGQYWKQGSKLIVNSLHSKIIPDQGGQTQFIDMVQGYNMVQKKYPQLLKRMQQSTAIVEMTHIPFFRGVQEGVFDAEMKSYHPITKTNALNKHYKQLHINYNGVLQKDGKQKLTINSTGHPLDPVKLVKLIMKQIGMYSHKYQVGDVVIWDNNQVMHQSTGYFKGNRSILRIQTDLIKQAQFISNLVEKEVYGAK